MGVLKRIVLFQNFFYDFLKGDQFNILKVPEACFLFVLLLPISLNKSNLEDPSDFEQDEMLAIKFWNKIQFWPLLGVHRNKIIFIVKLLHVEHLKYLEIMVSLFRFKSSCSQMFFKIGVLKKFSIFAGKHLCWSQKDCNSIEKRLQHKCFSVNIAKLLKTAFYSTLLVATSSN